MSGVLMSIDPGAISGAYALFSGRDVVVGDLPVVDGQLDAAALSRLVVGNRVALAVVEKVGAMPGQGVASTFKFGYAAGTIYGVLMALEVPLYYVSPRTWKRHYNLASDKEPSRALAIRMFPAVEGLHLKKHHGRAEALLLGAYFRARSNDQ